jgi:excisionase family DNA binding protein
MAVERLNVRQTAKLLGISESTVRNWADKGILRATRLPGSGYRRFDRKDVERLQKSVETIDEIWLRDRTAEYRRTLDYLRDH